MDYPIERRKSVTAGKYEKTEIDLAYAFSKEAYKEFSSILKGIILFGSTARNTQHPTSDIDILILVDDIGIVLSKELMETYRIICEKLCAKVSPRIHVTTLKFSTFFESMRNGDPLVVNIIRDGVPIVDTGFFEPMQLLLAQGRIRPTFESIWNYFARAQSTLTNSRWHQHRACEDLYWVVIDVSHAALMKLGVVPTSPEHIADLLDEKMVKTKLLDAKYVKLVRFFYDLYKAITKKTAKDITGVQYEKYYEQAGEYVAAIEKFLEKK